MRHRLPASPTASLHSCRLLQGLSSLIARSPTDFRLYCTSCCRVLFSVRSRYLFAIGLESCLVFAVDARDIHKEFPIPATLELTHTVLTQTTGLSPCVALRSRRLRLSGRVLRVSPEHHIAREGFGLDCVGFTRGYSRHLLRFLFLPVLRCFNSRRSPLRKAIAVGIPIRRSQVLRLRAASLGLSQLGPSVVGARAEPSTSWHSSHAVGNRTSHCDPG